MSERSTFRPDLEGLRAVAVVLVLLFHARVPGVSGGYVGVDVFFVLSGFLITGLLVRELSGTGRVDFPAFYARRARRLLPAAALTLIVTIAAAAVMLPPVRMPDVTGDTVAAGVYLSNMRFAVQATDYLGSSLPPSPILHFWSLGVEEQFYLFWPALLALVAGTAFAAGRLEAGLRRVAGALAVVFVLSLGVSLWLTTAAQPWAFFSLPARAWELALGGLLSLPAAGRFVPSRLAPWLGWTGVLAIVASGLLLSEATPFPGTAALLPTLGSALVIASGLRGPAPVRPARTGIVRFSNPGAFLSLAPMRYIGRISYSLYLWHWPILVLPEAALGHALSGRYRVALALLAVAVAAASQRWVEDPIRHGRFVGLASRRSLLLAGAASLLIATTSLSANVFAGTRLAATGPDVGGSITDVPLPSDLGPVVTARPRPSAGATGSPGPSGTPGSSPTPGASATPAAPPTLPPLAAAPGPARLVPSLANASGDLPVIYSDGCHLDALSTTPGTCAYGDPASHTTIVLFGDSHAAQWFPALLRLAQANDWRLESMTKSACASADVTVWNSIVKRAYTECDAWRQAVFARIAAERPALVVVSNSRGYQIMVGGTATAVGSHQDLWAAGLKRTLTRLQASAGNVVLIGDTPKSSADPPSCLSQHLDDASACAVPYAKAVDTAQTALQAGVAADVGVTWIDPTAWVCRTDPCPAILGRFLIYRDQHHLTATYSRALATRIFALLPPLGP